MSLPPRAQLVSEPYLMQQSRRKRIITMHAALGCLQRCALGLCLISTAVPLFGASRRIDGDVIIVPATKLPPEARVQGDAMALYFVDWDTLYLFIEEDEGRKVAIFDVSNPGKIRFKTLVPLDVPGPFDFVSLAGPNSMLIRFRDGSGEAILDLRKATDPQVRALSERPVETYIIPVGKDPSIDEQRNSYMAREPADYQVISSRESRPVATIRSVIQEVNDPDNKTTYLLGATGLTVVRNILAERIFSALFSPGICAANE